MNARCSLIVVAAWLLLARLAQAAEPVVVPITGEGAIELTHSLEFLVPDTALSYDDISQAKNNINFKRYTGMQDFIHGRDIWFRFTLHNPATEARSYVLDLDQALIDEIEIDYQAHGHAVHHITGVRHPLNTRTGGRYNIIFPLQLDAGETRVIYLRINIAMHSAFTPTLVDATQFTARVDKQNLAAFVPVGILLAVALYVIFVYVRQPKTENICAMFWFAFFGLASLLLYNGQLLPLFDQHLPLNNIVFSWIMAGTWISLLSLSRQYFDTRNNYPRLYRLLTVAIFVSLLFIALPFVFDNAMMQKLINSYGATVGLAINTSVLYLWLRHPPARNYYYFGLVAFSIFTAFSMLAAQGMIEPSSLSRYGYYIGLSLQTLAFLFAIAEKNQAQQEHMQHLLYQATIDTEKNNVRSHIIGKISHEVLTPLNGIMGMLAALQDSNPTPPQQHYLSAMRYSADSLLQIVNNIFDFRKIDAGELELHPIPSHFSQVIQGIISAVDNNKANTPAITFHTEIDPTIPPWLLIDANRLSQVISHLLSNAFKFTEKGTITFSATLCGTVQHQQCHVTFRVQDTGIGMHPHDLARLFQAFSQNDDSFTRDHGGIGLSLIICKKIVALMGGQISVDSKPHAGSTFSFTLRFTLCDRPPAATHDITAAPTAAREDTHRLRILVAEDNDVNRMVILGLLGKLAADTVCVHNGEQALLTLQQQHADFDLVLMDCEMPKMDGYTATQRIREHEQHYNLPPLIIIALTAHATDDFVARSMAAGMNDHLSKPINLAALRKSIQKNLPAGQPL